MFLEAFNIDFTVDRFLIFYCIFTNPILMKGIRLTDCNFCSWHISFKLLGHSNKYYSTLQPILSLIDYVTLNPQYEAVVTGNNLQARFCYGLIYNYIHKMSPFFLLIFIGMCCIHRGILLRMLSIVKSLHFDD